MQWYEPEEEEFVDAHRLYTTLRGAIDAPGLPGVAQAGFPASQDGDFIDEDAFSWLWREGFVESAPQLQSRIERFRNINGARGSLRNDMQRDLRRAQQLRDKLKQLDRQLAGGALFKSKAAKWKLKSERDAVAREIETLRVSAQRSESEVEKAGALLKGILDEIHRTRELQAARWYGQRAVVVTFNGGFLVDYCKDMNPEQFKGRSLADIIEIGHSLA